MRRNSFRVSNLGTYAKNEDNFKKLNDLFITCLLPKLKVLETILDVKALLNKINIKKGRHNHKI